MGIVEETVEPMFTSFLPEKLCISQPQWWYYLTMRREPSGTTWVTQTALNGQYTTFACECVGTNAEIFLFLSCCMYKLINVIVVVVISCLISPSRFHCSKQHKQMVLEQSVLAQDVWFKCKTMGYVYNLRVLGKDWIHYLHKLFLIVVPKIKNCQLDSKSVVYRQKCNLKGGLENHIEN